MSNTYTRTSDAQIVGPQTKTRTSDAYIIPGDTKILTSDAFVAVEADITSDAFIVGPSTTVITSDAAILNPAASLTITSDATIIGVNPGPPPPEPVPIVVPDPSDPNSSTVLGRYSCDEHINCPGADSPLANYSAEAPDQVQFIGLSFGPFNNTPPLGSDFQKTSCLGTCYGASQAEADACANAIASLCTWSNWILPIPVFYTQFFWNSPQSCTQGCSGGGGVNTQTVPANTFAALNQSSADSLASQYACLLALLAAYSQPDCSAGDFCNAAQTATWTSSNGTVYTYSVSAGVICDVSQPKADASAKKLAELTVIKKIVSDPGGLGSVPTTPIFPDIPDFPGVGSGLIPPIPTGGFATVSDPGQYSEFPLPPGYPVGTYYNNEAYCDATCPDGSPFRYVVPRGTFAALSQSEADIAAESYACRQARGQKVCIGGLSQTECCVGSNTTIKLAASSTSPVNVWEIVWGTVPPGMVFSSGVGTTLATIQGTPTSEGSYTFTVRVATPLGDYMQKEYTICAIDITPNPKGSVSDTTLMPDATAGTAYSNTLEATACASTPLGWSIVDGALPDGLSLDSSTGVISGTPTTSGDYTFTVQLDTQAS